MDLRIPYLAVESNSKCTVNFNAEASNNSHAGSSLIRSIKELMTKPERMSIRHVFREANQYANMMVKQGQNPDLITT
ncbi:hypothetical protein AHAS_Ahas16G0278800 [Arachis hypogaea]